MTRNSRGFTLIEVIIAVAIMAGGIIIVANSWSGNLLRVRKSRLYNNVALLLERKMTELEVKFKDKPLEEIPEELSGNFGTNYKQYKWKFESTKFEMPDLSSLLVDREGGADEMLITMVKQTNEFISTSVKEGTLTILVKVGKKEAQFSVTTYFIDYTRQFNLPGAGGNKSGKPNPSGQEGS